MSVPAIRQFDACEAKEVVGLWNLCLPRDEVTLATFRRKVVLGANFAAGGCCVAEADGSPVGFMLGIRRLYPLYDLGLEPGRGWLTAFFVHPAWRGRGVGAALLGRVLGHLRAQGVAEVRVADYTPNYFMPGIDLDDPRNAQQVSGDRHRAQG